MTLASLLGMYFWLGVPWMAGGLPSLVTVAIPTPALAAPSITLTAPLQPVTVPEGDDFFTQEMHHALAMEARRDIMWEEGFAEPTIGAAGGLWQGTFEVQGGYLFPLFHGFAGALNSGRLGANYPIDSTRFTMVSLRMRPSQRTHKVLYWSRAVDWPDGSLRYARQDAVVTGTSRLAPHLAGEFVVDLFDFASNPDWTGGLVRSLRVDPSLFAPAGTRVELDWVRVSDPSSAPFLPIRWTTHQVTVAGGVVPQVNVYADPGCQGHTEFLARVPYGAGRYDLPTAALPPGTYCFRLRLVDNDFDAVLASSGTSAPLTINARPTVRFLDPSPTTGPDYATDVVANPWDMDGPWDLDNLANPLYQKGFIDEAFVGGAFTGLAVVVPPALHSDAQAWLHVGAPIATSRYRWLTFQLMLDPSLYGNISDKVQFGWGARAAWWNSDLAVDGSSTGFQVLYEGVNTITIDLWDNRILDATDPYPAQSGWRGNGSVSHLRIDLAETSRPPGTYFALYDARLTAAPEPTLEQTFTVRLETGDLEGDTADLALFVDSDRGGFDGVLLDRVAVSPGVNGLTISTAAMPPGDHWLYVVLTDAWGKTVRRYADAPIHVAGPSCVGREGAEGTPVVTRDTSSEGKHPPPYCVGR